MLRTATHDRWCAKIKVCIHSACVLSEWCLGPMLQAYTHFAATRAQSSSLQQSALEAHADGNGVA